MNSLTIKACYKALTSNDWNCHNPIFFSSSFHSDCGFDHVIHSLSDAEFHGETDGVDCGALQASVFELMERCVKVCVLLY